MIERLKEAMESARMDQSALARAAGCTPGAINQLVNGNVSRSRFLPEVAGALGVSTSWLLGQTDDPAPGLVPVKSPLTPEVAAEQLDLVAVDEISLEFGMGSTVMHDDHETVRRYVPREWMEHFTSSPAELLRFARGRGESMYPTINNGDLLLIDTGQTRMTAQDEIWACGYGELGGIKRLRSMGKGMIKVMSDNPTVSDELFDMDELRIIGRVCGNLRKM